MIHVWDESGTWTPEAIVGLRARLGWSQERLARTIGRSTSAVQKFEAGVRCPSAETRRALDALALHTYERVS